MKKLIASVLFGIVGCSILSGTLTPQLLRDKAGFELCDMHQAIFQSEENRRVISKELNARNYDCADYLARKQGNINSAISNFSGYYNNKLQQDQDYYQRNRPTNCITQWFGNAYHTTCQ
jgi:hypothetical protein